MTFLSAAWAVLKASLPLKVAAALVTAFLGFKVWLWQHDWKVQDATVSKITKQVEKETIVVVEKAAKARERVYREPDAAKRLRAKYGTQD